MKRAILRYEDHEGEFIEEIEYDELQSEGNLDESEGLRTAIAKHLEMQPSAVSTSKQEKTEEVGTTFHFDIEGRDVWDLVIVIPKATFLT